MCGGPKKGAFENAVAVRTHYHEPRPLLGSNAQNLSMWAANLESFRDLAPVASGGGNRAGELPRRRLFHRVQQGRNTGAARRPFVLISEGWRFDDV
jgi:hypothetical protein